ncbi:hypothetical protein [Herpetosiphon sp. NSE202]|uniref:hypothetical protein n=1 Tax=Herpetosiphon sp. NSE202 TaxID=3351349 RepID=UPI0036354BDB
MSLITDVGDPLYVGSDPGNKFTLAKFVLARCGVVAYGSLDNAYYKNLTTYAKAIG